MALFLRIFHAAIDAPDLLGGYHQIADRPFAAKSSHSRLRLTMLSSMNWTKPGSLAALLLSKLLVKPDSAAVSSPLD